MTQRYFDTTMFSSEVTISFQMVWAHNFSEHTAMLENIQKIRVFHRSHEGDSECLT